MSPKSSADERADTYLQTLAQHGGIPGKIGRLWVEPDDEYDQASPDGPFMICQTCRVPLNRLTGNDGSETWLHSRGWRKYDHDPIPEVSSRATAENEQVCDFCATDTKMYWQFTGQRLRLQSGNTVHDYGHIWSACEQCGTHINNGDVEALMAHALRVSPGTEGVSKDGKEQIRDNWMRVWAQFLPTVHTRTYIGPRRQPAKLNPRMMPKLQQGLVKFWKSENLYKLINSPNRSVALPVPGVHIGDEDTFVVRYQPGDTMPGETWQNHVQHLVAGVWSSQLYWISAEFTRLATMAGHDLDKVIISREELPSPFGFMMFEEPIGEIRRSEETAAIRGLSWTLVPGGIWLNFYMQVEDGDANTDIEFLRANFGYLICPNTGSGLRFDQEIDLGPIGDGFNTDFITTVLATWFLMRQPGVAEQNRAPVDKKAARAFQRTNNRPLPDVQLVDLRRQPHRTTTDTDGHEGRKLTVRVYRRGHWKRQFYGPGRALRKTIYVSAYIAGPEDAPLKEAPRKVHVLR